MIFFFLFLFKIGKLRGKGIDKNVLFLEVRGFSPAYSTQLQYLLNTEGIVERFCERNLHSVCFLLNNYDVRVKRHVKWTLDVRLFSHRSIL